MFFGQKPAVIAADDRADLKEYSFPSPDPPSWFAGLKAKLAQLAGISEWMNQLNPSKDNVAPRGGAEEYSDDIISYDTIRLDQAREGGSEYVDDGWDWGTCLLADLNSSHVGCDTLERQHFGPLKDLLTSGKLGEGHEFETIDLLQPTWCDKCGDFIWGVLKQASKCRRCNLTCHERCQQLVTLDCRSAGSSLASDDFPSLHLYDGTLGTLSREKHFSPRSSDSDKENSIENPMFGRIADLPAAALRVEEVYVKEDTPFEWGPQTSDGSLRSQIETFNSTARGMEISMTETGEFTGFLHIHMNFTRPISVVAGEMVPDVYNVDTCKSTAHLRTITSFFLPRNTVKTIRLNSDTTTRQMIVVLLKKFRVADNPRKFALYECSQDADVQTNTLLRKMVRIPDGSFPLRVALGWGKEAGQKSLILQENDTGDILWDAFEVPELENFLRILALEEQQYCWQIKQRFSQYSYALDSELRRRRGEERASAPPATPISHSKDESTGLYDTTTSLVLDEFHTLRDEPLYVNVEELRLQQSTRL